MKHLITIIVVTVLCLKLFGSFVVRLANAPSTRLSNALSFDPGNVFDFLRLGDTPQHSAGVPLSKQKTAKATVIKFLPNKAVFTVKAFVPKKITPSDVKKILAANEMKALQDKKNEEDNKEKERRKKRRKSLEQLADKVPQNPYRNFIFRDANLAPDASAGQPPIGGGQQAENRAAQQSGKSATKGNVPVLTQAKAFNLTALADQLVNHPTSALVKNLISQFRSNQITAVQFFHVLGSMQKSHISDSRRFAVITAAQFQRIESFELLSEESFLESDSTIQTLTSQALQTYQNISQLSVISSALSGGGIEAKIRASEVLDRLITAFTVNKNPPSNVETLLNPFLALLEPLTHNQNPTLNASATTAYQDIQKLPTILGSL